MQLYFIVLEDSRLELIDPDIKYALPVRFACRANMPLILGCVRPTICVLLVTDLHRLPNLLASPAGRIVHGTARSDAFGAVERVE